MKASVYVACVLCMCVSCHADKYLLPLLKTAEQITTNITGGGNPCNEDCPYSYGGKEICGFCCNDYGKRGRKCPAYVNDYNGCGPGDKTAEKDPGVKRVQDLINLHGGDGDQTATFFAPICNYHDMCYQDPTKTAGICNANFDRELHAFCDAYYGPSNVDWNKIGPGLPRLGKQSLIQMLKKEQSDHLFSCSLTASEVVNTVKGGSGVIFGVKIPHIGYYNTAADKNYAKQCKKPKTGHKEDGCIMPPPPPKHKPPPPKRKPSHKKPTKPTKKPTPKQKPKPVPGYGDPTKCGFGPEWAGCLNPECGPLSCCIIHAACGTITGGPNDGCTSPTCQQCGSVSCFG